MKLLKLRLLLLLLAASPFAKSQSWELTSSAGLASYYGDLVQSNPFFREPSYAIGVGGSYNFTPHWAWRSELTFSQVKAHDSKNKRVDLQARNLNFKSAIWDINTEAQYSVYDISAGEHIFTPYVFLGVGLFHFNPTTVDRNGTKINLKLAATEGQGTAAYPDRKPYKTTQLQMPFGFGFKFALNDKMLLGFEFKYHYLDTDYLDDVSQSGYPDQAAVANPQLTYRGDELPGGAPYPPKGNTLPRGNPNNNDSYYTAQFTFAWRLKSSKIEVNY